MMKAEVLKIGWNYNPIQKQKKKKTGGGGGDALERMKEKDDG